MVRGLTPVTQLITMVVTKLVQPTKTASPKFGFAVLTLVEHASIQVRPGQSH